jgi:hypothetical protein
MLTAIRAALPAAGAPVLRVDRGIASAGSIDLGRELDGGFVFRVTASPRHTARGAARKTSGSCGDWCAARGSPGRARPPSLKRRGGERCR